jgi:hypothetical protein
MILGFLLTALYFPSIGGAATTPRWGLLAVALPLVLLFGDWRRPIGGGKQHLSAVPMITAGHIWGALFLVWSAVSISWTPNRLDGTGEWIKLLVLALAFVHGSRLTDIRSVIVGMGFGLIPSSLLIVMEPWTGGLTLHTTNYAGLFINSGSLAEIAALVIIGLVYGLTEYNRRDAGDVGGKPYSSGDNGGNRLDGRHHSDIDNGDSPHSGDSGNRIDGRGAIQDNERKPLYWSHRLRARIRDRLDIRVSRSLNLVLILALLPCVILPQSRGAWLGLLAAFLVWLWGKSKLWTGAALVLGAVLFAYSIHIGWHVSSVTQRIGLWTDAISGMTLLGHGIGSLWTDYAPLSRTLDIFIERPEHLHNDALEIAFEGGVIGSILAVGFVLSCYGGKAKGAASLIFVAFLAESLVGFPLHNACTAFLAAVCLGRLASSGHRVRIPLNDGGMGIRTRDDGRPDRNDDRWTQGQRGLVSVGSPVSDSLCAYAWQSIHPGQREA